MRRCGRCQESKPLDDFAWRRKARGQRDNYCRPAVLRTSRSTIGLIGGDISTRPRRKKALVAERLVYLMAFLAEHPCVDCGEGDPVVLESDHLRDKEFCIGKGFWDRSWQSVLDEIAKCEVVCANCHRRRTARRGGFARAAVAQW